MKVNELLTVVIVAMVGAILLVGFVPVIGATQTTIGDIVVINNDNITPTADYTNTDIVMTIGVINDTDGYSVYINDTGYPKPIVTKIGLITDKLVVNISSATNRAIELKYWDDELSEEINVNVTTEVSITYTHSTHTLDYSDGVRTLSYVNVPFVFCWDKNGQYGEVIQNNTYPYKVFRMSDITSGNWGIFDTNGIFTINEVSHRGIISASKYGVIAYFEDNPNWTVTLDYGTPVLVDGTTDLYTGLNPVFVITDENGNSIESSPYRAFVLNDASGHSTSGSLYDIYGLIPLIVAIGLLMFVITAILIRRV